tara:strand:- start:8233 stop:8409 length:177 start_codon:yes stop_codon:yes gene_type:complete
MTITRIIEEKLDIISAMVKVERENYARKFLKKHKMTKKQKEQAMKILVDFQRFIDLED